MKVTLCDWMHLSVREKHLCPWPIHVRMSGNLRAVTRANLGTLSDHGPEAGSKHSPHRKIRAAAAVMPSSVYSRIVYIDYCCSYQHQCACFATDLQRVATMLGS
jgi:hypothetical protein